MKDQANSKPKAKTTEIHTVLQNNKLLNLSLSEFIDPPLVVDMSSYSFFLSLNTGTIKF